MSGKTPLVSRIALLHHGELPPRILRYTRRVTQLWTVFFTLLFLETLFLAFFGPLLTWSIYTNILNYLFAAGLMVGEYFFRIYRFKEVQHLSFFGFIRLLSKASVHSLR